MSDEPEKWEWRDGYLVRLPADTADRIGNRGVIAEWTGETEAHMRLIAAAPEMLALLRELAVSIPDTEGCGDRKAGCACCEHDSEWPEDHPTHKPDCRLAALLARIDG